MLYGEEALDQDVDEMHSRLTATGELPQLNTGTLSQFLPSVEDAASSLHFVSPCMLFSHTQLGPNLDRLQCLDTTSYS